MATRKSTTETAPIARQITWDSITADFACSVEGQFIGYARTYADGETKCDTFIREQLEHERVEDLDAQADADAAAEAGEGTGEIVGALCDDTPITVERNADGAIWCAEAKPGRWYVAAGIDGSTSVCHEVFGYCLDFPDPATFKAVRAFFSSGVCEAVLAVVLPPAPPAPTTPDETVETLEQHAHDAGLLHTARRYSWGSAGFVVDEWLHADGTALEIERTARLPHSCTLELRGRVQPDWRPSDLLSLGALLNRSEVRAALMDAARAEAAAEAGKGA